MLGEKWDSSACYNDSMMLEALYEKLPNILPDFSTIRLVYLFGSRATGNVGPMSDYDIAILLGPDEDIYATQAAFQHEIVKILKTDRVDVVILNRTPVELAYQVVAKGKLLYQQSNYIRVEYESDVLSRYGDYLPVLRYFKEKVLQGDDHGRRVQRYREALRRTERTLGSYRTPQEPKPK